MNEPEIFAAAIKLSGAARHAFLDATCGQDAQKREQIEALLKAHDESGGLLPKLSDPQRDETHVAPGQPVPGVVIAGRYKLLEQIGEEGMGTVWVAEQSQPVKRKVALKLIKAGMDSRSVLARFEAERQALALMDHPNIAKVLDGGLTETGRPYFVMDYVKGVPITEYCDAVRLGVPDRLQLFVQVCEAVQHAHQKGIIHRDLKPSNILVAPYDDKPVPKVIDFGLAKAMNQSLTEKTLHTAHDMVLGTPQYMSPEQATFNNLDIDTRSDVYSLGTLLYELLAGSPPFAQPELEKRGLLEILRVVREEEPPRPSLKLSTGEARASISANRGSEPAQLSTMMQGEIDWIVMKALEKDRTRRYDTATALAKDVQRYLNGDAVEACPPTLGYRMRKAYRRNRTAVWVASAFVLLMCVHVAVSSFLAMKALRAERVAEVKRIEAEENANIADETSTLHLAALQKAINAQVEAEIVAVGLQIDLDIRELETDPKVGLLSLARPPGDQSASYQWTNPADKGLMTTSVYYGENTHYVALREFVTAAVLTTGQNYAPLLPPLSHDGGSIRTSQLSSDARVAMTLGHDGIVRLWDSITARQIAALREQDELILVCGFSPDGTTAVTDDMNGVARFWDAATGKLKAKTVLRPERYQRPDDWTYERMASCTSAGFTFNDGFRHCIQIENSRLLTGRFAFIQRPTIDFSQAELWDTTTGAPIARIDTPKRSDQCQSVFIAGGKFIVAVEDGSQVAIYSAEDGRLVKRIEEISDGNVDQIAVSPSGRRMAIKGDGLIRVWDTHTWLEDLGARTIPKSEFGGPLVMLSDSTASTTGTGDMVYGTTVWGLGEGKPAIDYHGTNLTVRSNPDLSCLDDGRLFDSGTWKRLVPPDGRKYHPDVAQFAGDQRFAVLSQSSSAWIDICTNKACPGSGPWQHRQGFGMVRSVPMYYPQAGQIHVIPTTRLDIPSPLLQLWAQVAVRGELGPDGEFVKWNEETWEQKRQELAAAKPPYEDFPFPGYVATDKLHWLRVEYKGTEDDIEKLRLIDELLRRSEESGDKNEAVRWRTERAKYVNEAATPEQQPSTP